MINGNNNVMSRQGSYGLMGVDVGKSSSPPLPPLPPPSTTVVAVNERTTMHDNNHHSHPTNTDANRLRVVPPRCSAQSSVESGPDTTEGSTSNFSTTTKESNATTTAPEVDELMELMEEEVEFPPLPALPPEAAQEGAEAPVPSAAHLLRMSSPPQDYPEHMF